MKIKLIRPSATLPRFAHPEDAGADLFVSVFFDQEGHELPTESVTLHPYQGQRMGLGIATEIPDGYYVQVVPRSSIAKRGLLLPNSVGIIDSNYRGEWFAFLINLSPVNQTIRVGDRLLQMIVCKKIETSIQQVDELSDSNRGENGFGSTG